MQTLCFHNENRHRHLINIVKENTKTYFMGPFNVYIIWAYTSIWADNASEITTLTRPTQQRYPISKNSIQ